MVRAKFVVDEVAETRHSGYIIKLSAVTGDSEENKTFWKWTPSGQINFNCVNEEAVKQFEVGKEYYVDFNLAEVE